MQTTSRREAGVEDGPSLVRTASGREADEGSRGGEATDALSVGDSRAGPLGGETMDAGCVGEASSGHRGVDAAADGGVWMRRRHAGACGRGGMDGCS